jgi:predicted nuclease with RNAse H fold
MFFAQTVFVGLDPTAGQRPMHYCVLNSELELEAMDASDEETILSMIAGFQDPVVAVGAPQGPNQGLMRRPEFRQRHNLRPEGKTWRKWRVAEFELRRRNIRLHNTPGEEGEAAGWVQNGISIFRRLREMGFRELRLEVDRRGGKVLEVQPHACYTALLGHRPFSKDGLEGRMQRQLVLYLEGVDLPNPLRCLEEVTRHRLLSGHLPLEGLCGQEDLDALMCAYTAYVALTEPERACQVGDPGEGLITVPVAQLKDHYP